MKKLMMFICAVSLSGSVVMAQESRLVDTKVKMDDNELKIKEEVTIKPAACLAEVGTTTEFDELNSNGETADVEIVSSKSKCSTTPTTKVTSDKVKTESCTAQSKVKEDKVKIESADTDAKFKATKAKDEKNGVDWKLDENSILPLGDIVELDEDGEKVIVKGADGSETKLKEDKLKYTDSDSQLKMKDDKTTLESDDLDIKIKHE